MTRRTIRRAAIAALSITCLVGSLAAADYETNPELRPSVRCAGLEDASSPTGYGPDCQPLFWDIPAAMHVGQRALATPSAVPGFLNGLTDRPPPLYTDGADGYERPGAGRTRLCPDPDQIPYWRPTGERETVDTLTGPREAEWHEVACRRGSRAYLGPWQLGTKPDVFDKIVFGVLRFESTERIDRDVAAGRAVLRREWNVSSATFTHHAAHHGVCDVSRSLCNNPADPAHAASEECRSYREAADRCPASSPRTSSCSGAGFDVHRSIMGRQGRFTFDLPGGRGLKILEDAQWQCNIHVIADEPPAYGSTTRRNFRKQVGGSVAEAVIDLYTAPDSAVLAPVSFSAEALENGATTWVPPFTLASQESVWHVPFDLAIGMTSMHSHESMVKGRMEILPAAVPRADASPGCGSPAAGDPSPSIYENYSYADPRVCNYWREPGGPIIVRKGQAIRTHCIVNNGVTPTLHVGDPAIRAALEESFAGREALYGQQPAETYRVRYGCEELPSSAAAAVPAYAPPGLPLMRAKDCPPNPEVDSVGGVIDGPYDAPEYCPRGDTFTGRCVPASQAFADAAEDAMCIGIMMFWPLERLTNADGSVDPEARQDLEEGRADEVGTPGHVPRVPSDPGYCDDGSGSGNCSSAGL
jgi:hypothetical protein